MLIYYNYILFLYINKNSYQVLNYSNSQHINLLQFLKILFYFKSYTKLKRDHEFCHSLQQLSAYPNLLHLVQHTAPSWCVILKVSRLLIVSSFNNSESISKRYEDYFQHSHNITVTNYDNFLSLNISLKALWRWWWLWWWWFLQLVWLQSG